MQAFKDQKSVETSSHIAGSAAIIKRRIKPVDRRFLSFLIGFAALFSEALFAIDLPDFKGLVAKKGQAVVKVTVTARKPSATGIGNLPNFNEEALPEFYRRFFEELPNLPRAPQRDSPSSGFGSGFILTDDGYVVTNAHVAKDAVEIQVALPDRREFDAVLVGIDERTDVALLKVEANGLPTLPLGDSDALKVGQWVLAIGSPFGFEYTATQGIVSALTRNLPNESYVPFIQTDVAVNPGNSGGPLFDLDGNVVGVNSQIYSRSGGYMGLSFAIPINIVESVVRQLREKGYVSRGWLGVTIQEVDVALAESFGMDKPEGALVAQVTEGSPAADAGIQAGDVILQFNSGVVARSADLPPLVGSTDVGETVDVRVLRNRREITIGVAIRELVEERPETTPVGVDNGVIVTEIESDSIAALSGIAKDDIVVSINQVSITSMAQFRRVVGSLQSGQTVAVLIFLAVPVP